MKQKKNITKEMIENGMKHTHSISGLAQYLKVTPQHLTPFMKIFFNEEGKSLYELHKNIGQPGVRKNKLSKVGKIKKITKDFSKLSQEDAKSKLLKESHLKNECNRCGFGEKRITDGKVPLLFFFKSGKKDFSPLNAELLCYNCYFLTVGDCVNTKRSVIEYVEYEPEIEEYVDCEMLANMKELGLI